ncbi:MAG: transglutaminase domain-containing protein [Deltaproteobacteria bacterium]|nr:transglutaminase domain-containing protein [Deltaproteobacteria bacterium]
MNPVDSKYLTATPIIDSDHPSIIDYAAKATGETRDMTGRAVKLYYAVRDGIWYDPYYPFYLPEHYRASNVLKSGRGYCVCKASLLCALGRACSIPSRMGFADVKNHLATRQLLDFLGSDLFVYHGFVEFYLEGKWVKATPAFNRELCERHRVAPLEFNGHNDSVFHLYNLEKKLFMEYVADRGTYADIPVDLIVTAWKEAYGEERVNGWIRGFEESGEATGRDFYREEVL